MDFNWKVYKILNPDLEKAGLRTQRDYARHYENHGKQEKRKSSIYEVYPDFNPTIYRENYDDLTGLNVEEHYLLHGEKEGRIYNKTIRKIVYIIHNIERGGTVKYVEDLKRGFPNNKYIHIKKRNQFLQTNFTENDVILLQQLLHTKILFSDIINLKNTKNIKIVLCIHDFYWLDTNFTIDYQVNPHSRYLETKEMLPEARELFSLCDIVIHPSRMTFDTYSHFCDNKNFVLVPHNDASVRYCKNIPYIVDKIINIGFLHEFLEVKGGEYLVRLFNKYRVYRDYTINYIVVGKNVRPYKEEEYFEFIKKLNIHCLLYLSKWGETWSYSLTKALNSGLPILYNNFGAFKERIPHSEHYFVVHQDEKDVDNDERLYDIFEKLLEYIINNNGTISEMNDDLTVHYQDFYKKLLAHSEIS